jgi:hypothetical protein
VGALHELISQHGRIPAKRLVALSDLKLVDLAASVLGRESLAPAYFTSGLGNASLPHRAKQAETPHRVDSDCSTIVVEPGHLIDADGDIVYYGVPFGPRGRLILLFLQSEAVRQQSPIIQHGFTMSGWLERMQIQPGGKTYAAFREQQQRIAACRVTRTYATDQERSFFRQPIVEGPLELFVNKPADAEPVVINKHLFETWIKDPVPIWEGAAFRLSSQSLAIDAYCWLASILHKLDGPITIDWPSVHRIYGSSYSLVRHFKPRFVDCLKMALAVYPEARVDVDNEQGVRLFPSPPPVQLPRNS